MTVKVEATSIKRKFRALYDAVAKDYVATVKNGDSCAGDFPRIMASLDEGLAAGGEW